MVVRLSTGVLLALLAVAPAPAQSGDVAPLEAPSGRSARVFVDTTVREVIVDDSVTVAVMAPSPQSPCPSDRYVFERERPKWLNTTGRIMEAQREGAALRISFSCVRGYQSINAIQFLSPPPAVADRTLGPEPAARETTDAPRPRLDGSDRVGMATTPAPQSEAGRGARFGAAPLPTDGSAGRSLPAPASSDRGPGSARPSGDATPAVNERLRAVPQP